MKSFGSLNLSLPTRLHLGLLDLSNSGLRVDGGLGLMLSHPSTRLSVRPGSKTDDILQNPLKVVERALNLRMNPGFGICLDGSRLQHVGLGFETQIRLGIATAILWLAGKKVHPSGLPPLVGRGGTSGIGSWGFWTGGFVVDGGHARKDKGDIGPSSGVARPKMAPLTCRADFPWKPVIALAREMGTVHGSLERVLFEKLTPIPRQESLEGYEILYGGIIPAVLEKNFERFTYYLERYSATGFKRREIEYRGTAGQRCMGAMVNAGLRGVTMSSWGPTFVGFAKIEADAKSAIHNLKNCDAFSDVLEGLVSPRGAEISVSDGESMPVSELSTIDDMAAGGG